MTVIIGFTCPSRKASFLGSDDLSGADLARHDKIINVQDKFFVGCIGNSTVLDAARIINMLGPEQTTLRDSGTIFQAPKDINEVCELIKQCLPRIAICRQRVLERSLEDGNTTEDQKKLIWNQSGSLVFVDHVNHKLAEANFGPIFPSRATYEFQVISYAPERAFRFGINDPCDIGVVDQAILEKPFQWCGVQIKAAKETLEKSGFTNRVGNLGACRFAKGKNIRVRTAFESLLEVLDQFYPPIDSEQGNLILKS